MAIYKDEKRGTWYVSVYVKDEFGIKRHKVRRGFGSRIDAQKCEKRIKAENSGKKNMLFSELTELYFKDMEKRLRKTSVISKKYVIRGKILPVFGDMNVYEITPTDIRKWQDDLFQSGYAPTYLRTIQEQISAIFNFAVRYYDLPKNPCLAAGSMGKGTADEMEIWTIDDFYRFLETLKYKPVARAGFMILFWMGLRLGEMLGLTVGDIDFENKTLRVNKSLQRIHGQDVITPPKTPKSNRILSMPDVLVEELKRYVDDMPIATAETRLIPMSRTVVERELKRGIRRAGNLKDIHPHSLRHSHTALIASLGATPVEAAERLGHENVTTTLNIYSHVLPGWQTQIANELDRAYKQTKEPETPEEQNNDDCDATSTVS